MRNVKLTVQYEGTRYCGWQRQPDELSVQEVLEDALGKLTGVRPSVTGSGRTDAGVHALGQVASFFTKSSLPIDAFVAGTNSYLPEDVAVVDAREVPEWFSARRSAVSKTYRYTIFNAPVRPVIERNFVCYVKQRLDIPLMKEASSHFVGTHDFTSFCSQGGGDKNRTRTIISLTWDENPPRIAFSITGTGFLYNMVRAIAGTLIEVGKGKLRPDGIVHLIERGDRSAAGPTAPARGLCLVSVSYGLDVERGL